MPTNPIPDDVLTKAERKLRTRSAGVSIFSGCLSAIFTMITIIAFANWFFSTPQLREWLTNFGNSLGTLVQPILDRLAEIPGGFPTPLILMFVLSVIFSIVTGIAKASAGYINFKKYDESKKNVEKEARRMIRNEESGWNAFQRFLDEIQVHVSGMDDKAQRQFKKFRTWVDMWKEIPDEPEKAKRKVKRDEKPQTVRLSDDGELIYEDETPKHASRSLNE